jgi:hypothetical protein
MYDPTGTDMCAECAADALEFAGFTDRSPAYDEPDPDADWNSRFEA